MELSDFFGNYGMPVPLQKIILSYTRSTNIHDTIRDEDGTLIALKYLDINLSELSLYRVSLTIETISRGYFDSVKYLLSISLLEMSQDYVLLYNSCRNDNIELTDWLCDYYKEKIKRDIIIQMFRSACTYGTLNKIKWLHGKFKLTLEECTSGNYSLLKVICQQKINIVKWFDSTFQISTQEWCKIAKEVFYYIFVSCNTDVAIFICDKAGLSVNDCKEYKSNTIILRNKKVEDIKRFCKEFQFTSEEYINQFGFIFRKPFHERYIEIAKWLYKELNLTPKECGEYYELIRDQ